MSGRLAVGRKRSGRHGIRTGNPREVVSVGFALVAAMSVGRISWREVMSMSMSMMVEVVLFWKKGV